MFKSIAKKIKMSMVAILATTTLLGATTATAQTATTKNLDETSIQSPLEKNEINLENAETETGFNQNFEEVKIPVVGSESTQLSIYMSVLDLVQTQESDVKITAYKTQSKNKKYSSITYKVNNQYIVLNVNNKLDVVEKVTLSAKGLAKASKNLKKVGIKANDKDIKNRGLVYFNDKGEKAVLYNNQNSKSNKVSTSSAKNSYVFVSTTK